MLGSIDPSEWGSTSRYNVNLISSKASTRASFKNQFYYSRYDFDLFSNFSFFLKDRVNGDQIEQSDHRNLFGYSGTFQRNRLLGNKKLESTLASGFRFDQDTSLLHTRSTG